MTTIHGNRDGYAANEAQISFVKVVQAINSLSVFNTWFAQRVQLVTGEAISQAAASPVPECHLEQIQSSRVN